MGHQGAVAGEGEGARVMLEEEGGGGGGEGGEGGEGEGREQQELRENQPLLLQKVYIIALVVM